MASVSSNQMERNFFTTKEIRWLLVEMKDSKPEIRVKFRLSTGGWQPAFYKLTHVDEMNVVYIDERRNQMRSVPLSDIAQFTIDKMFRKMQPYVFYDVLLRKDK